MYIYLHIQNTEVLVESSLLLMSDQCTGTCSRPFVINNFNYQCDILVPNIDSRVKIIDNGRPGASPCDQCYVVLNFSSFR
jgi:hypothetical protein